MPRALARATLALLVGASCVAGGCSYRSVVEVQTSCLDACRGTLTQAQLAAHVEAWSELQATFSGAIAGDKELAGAASALGSFAQALVSGTAGLPGGLSYQGGGVLSAQPTSDARVAVRFYLASATSYGRPGDPITFNVFDPDSYFQGLSASTSVTIDLSGVHTSLQIHFTKAGPGAELLGLGASPANPLPVDVGQLTSRLGAVGVAVTTTVDRLDGPTAIHLQVATPPQPASSVGTAIVPLELRSFTGTRADLGQVLSVDSFQISSVQGGATLTGTALVRSASGGFSFQMLFSFPSSALADIVLGCPGAALAAP